MPTPPTSSARLPPPPPTEVGEGTVTAIEYDRNGYDVEIRRADGTEVDVALDAAFAVVRTEVDDDRDNDDGVLEEAARAAATDAAVASVGEGTVIAIEADDNGYDVEVRRPDGSEADVELTADFSVVDIEEDD